MALRRQNTERKIKYLNKIFVFYYKSRCVNNFAVFFVGVNSCHVCPSFAEDVKSSFFVDLSIDLIAK